MEDINLGNEDGDLLRDKYSIIMYHSTMNTTPKAWDVAYMNVKQIDIKDVSESPALNNTQETVNELTERYTLGTRTLFEKHASITVVSKGKKTCTMVHTVTTWCKTSTNTKRMTFLYIDNNVKVCLYNSHKQWETIIIPKIEARSNDQKYVFNITIKLLVNQRAVIIIIV